jgi:hypothetical protein
LWTFVSLSIWKTELDSWIARDDLLQATRVSPANRVTRLLSATLHLFFPPQSPLYIPLSGPDPSSSHPPTEHDLTREAALLVIHFFTKMVPSFVFSVMLASSEIDDPEGRASERARRGRKSERSRLNDDVTDVWAVLKHPEAMKANRHGHDLVSGRGGGYDRQRAIKTSI